MVLLFCFPHRGGPAEACRCAGPLPRWGVSVCDGDAGVSDAEAQDAAQRRVRLGQETEGQHSAQLQFPWTAARFREPSQPEVHGQLPLCSASVPLPAAGIALYVAHEDDPRLWD